MLEERVATLTDCAKCTSNGGDAPPLLPECINGVNIKDFFTVYFNAMAPAFTRDSPSRALLRILPQCVEGQRQVFDSALLLSTGGSLSPECERIMLQLLLLRKGAQYLSYLFW